MAAFCALGRYWNGRSAELLRTGVGHITSDEFTTCAAVCIDPNTHLPEVQCQKEAAGYQQHTSTISRYQPHTKEYTFLISGFSPWKPSKMVHIGTAESYDDRLMRWCS